MAKEIQLEINEENNSLIPQYFEDVMHNAMMPYSEYVILDRALPRIEDGLKPVQRRILYTMHELGITHDKPHKKCARIVGDCLGKYHPHGDSSVYSAIVRMAQEFNMGQTLIDGHGNFGSIDGDGAAAMRYTEARMSPLAEELLKDLDKDTVDWVFNFDDSLKEPQILPGRFPNLLVNGASGIAVGFATKIPTHNLQEVIDAAISLIDKPNSTVDDLMKYMPAPDMPTGGYIIQGEGIKQAYETGRGKFVMRAKLHIENAENDKKNIVITELPYEVVKAKLLMKIDMLTEQPAKGAKTTGKNARPVCMNDIIDIVDESGRRGMRAVIKCKRDADIAGILNYLYLKTELRTTFNANMIVIADGKPKQMGIVEMLKYYVEYQRKIILRRSQYDLGVASARAEIVEGLMIAIANIDEIIAIIKSSSSTTEAKSRMKERFLLSEKQAQAIIEMRIGRLVKMEVTKLEQELAELKKTIERLRAIVSSKKEQFNVVKTELRELKKRYKTPRKSTIVASEADIDITSNMDDEARTGIVCLTHNRQIKFVNERAYITAIKSTNVARNYDCPRQSLKISVDKPVYAFTNKGNVCRLYFNSIEHCRWNSLGEKLSTFISDIEKDEYIVKMLSLDEICEQNIYLVTKKGSGKRTSAKDLIINKDYYKVMMVKGNDEIVSVDVVDEQKQVFVATKKGMALAFEWSEIPIQGRSASGVQVIKLQEKDSILNMLQITDRGDIMVSTNKGYIKKMMGNTFDLTKRNNKGVSIYDLTDRTGSEIVMCEYVEHGERIGIVYDMDKALAVNTDEYNPETRASRGSQIDISTLSLGPIFMLPNK